MAQLDRLKTMLQISGNGEDGLLQELLESAKYAILSRRYPFGGIPDEFDNRYSDLQVRIAMHLYNKIGIEGQTGHSENGISRSFEEGDIPESLLGQVVPLVGFPKG
jgi:hypothetical protein